MKIPVTILLGVAGILFFYSFATQTAYAHAQYDHSNPAAGATLPSHQPPTQVQVWFTENIEPKFSSLQVVNTDNQRIDAGNSQPIPGTTNALQIGLQPNLPDGVYTVIFENVSSDDGHHVKSNFSFVVGEGTLPAGAVGGSLLDNEGVTTSIDSNFNFWSVSLRWLNYLALCGLVGLVLFWLLVWRPALLKIGEALISGADSAALAYRHVTFRLYFLLGISLVLLCVGWLGFFIYQATTVSSSYPWQLFQDDTLVTLLFSSRFGTIWLVRLGLIILATLVWFLLKRSPLEVPTFAAVSSSDGAGVGQTQVEEIASSANATLVLAQTRRAKGRGARAAGAVLSRPDPRWWLLLVLGIGLMLTTSLDSHSSASKAAFLLVPNDLLHLVSTGVWIGGIVGLVLGMPVGLAALKPGTGDRTRLLAALIPKFSNVALVSVVVLVVSGVIQAIVQLGRLDALFTTTYGISLVVKLSLFVPLIGLGAYNLNQISPRMRRYARYQPKKDGPNREEQLGAGSVGAGNLQKLFRLSTRWEFIIMLVLLVAVGALTSFSPPQGTGYGNDTLIMHGETGGINYALAINPAKLGANVLEVQLVDTTANYVPVENVRLVLVELTMLDMDNMGSPQEVELKPVTGKPGRYTATNTILSMPGNWSVKILLQRDGKEDVNIPLSFKLNQ
ncbi:MAG: CopD family protein [Chloroflexi bacterium]|nr:CopD family protein [Chloroflexota bacterium]OJW02610.1 MAG: hypothetical protein BGO39_08685 [Chloroflexi bacterium 54-19]